MSFQVGDIVIQTVPIFMYDFKKVCVGGMVREEQRITGIIGKRARSYTTDKSCGFWIPEYKLLAVVKKEAEGC